MKKTVSTLAAVAIAAGTVVVTAENGLAFFGKRPAASERPAARRQAPSAEEQLPPAPPVEAAPAEERGEEKAAAVKRPPAGKKKSLPDTLDPREAPRLLLNNSRWQIEIYRMDGQGTSTTDALVFENNQVVAESLQKNGSLPTNYSISLREDQGPLWETMQTLPDGETIFWRGELDIDFREMRGVMSRQNAEGESQDYSFISRGKSSIEQKPAE